MSERSAAVIVLTQGNIDQGHFYLRGCLDLFPADAIGGPNKDSAGVPVEVTFSDGQSVKTDIAGDKALFRRWRSTKANTFFAHERVDAGSVLLIERTGERTYSVRPVRISQRERAVAAAEEYAAQFATDPPGESTLKALLAHAQAGVLTARAIAWAASWPNYNTANLNYGKFGKALADALDLTLPRRSDGSEIGTSALAADAGRGGAARSGDFEWAIHPEVVEGLLMAGLMETRPEWLTSASFASLSLTDESILEMIEADPPRVWIKGYWGWTPENWGGVGFTNRNDRDQLLADLEGEGGLFVIYGTRSGQTDRRERGKVLGVCAVVPEAGSISRFVDAGELKKARSGDEASAKWEYAIRAVRSWGVPVELAPFIEDFANKSYDPADGQNIAARGKRLSAAETRKLLDMELFEQDVYGVEPVGPNIAGPLSARLDAPARGGPVTHSGYFVEPQNAPRHAYILKLGGDPAAFLNGLRNVTDGEQIIKVGLSRHPVRRCADINRNYPRSAFEWTVLHSTYDEGLKPIAPNIALNIETQLKRQLDRAAISLGGEFFLVDQDALRVGWRTAKTEFRNHQ